MKVYLGFSKRPRNLISETICLAERSKYSHVYVRVISKYGEYVYQASGIQVNFMNINVFKKHNIIVEEYEFDIDDAGKTKLLTFFIKYAGVSYSMKSLFKIAIMMICDKIKFKGDGEDTFICSELGALFSEVILGVDIDENTDFITPKRLNLYIKKYGKRVI